MNLSRILLGWLFAPICLLSSGVSAQVAASPGTASVVEYYYAAADEYFISADPAEISALDNNRFPGWVRTGLVFGAYATATAGASPVCRFFIPPASHFYSASPAECALTQQRFPNLVYESANVFYIDLPDMGTGACPLGTIPVYRLFDNRVDPNHRYTPSTAVVDQMRARDWIPEGYGLGPYYPIMCSPSSFGVAITPDSAVLHLGSFQQFSASVLGDPANSVTWSVNGIPGGNASVGTISATGVYVPPLATPRSFTVAVTATSQVDPLKSAISNVTVLSNVEVVNGFHFPVASGGGGSAAMQSGCGLVPLGIGGTVIGSPDNQIILSVNGIVNGNAAVGTLNSLPAGYAQFCVPPGLTQPTFWTMATTSVADPLKSFVQLLSFTPLSYSEFFIGGDPTLRLGGSCYNVAPGQQITIPVNQLNGVGTAVPPGVTFAVNGVPGGNSTVGTVTAGPGTTVGTFNLTYAAPLTIPSPSQVMVQVLDSSDGRVRASKGVTVALPPQGNVTVSVTPRSASVPLGDTVQFDAVVSGVADQSVTWSIIPSENEGFPLYSPSNAYPTLGTISSTGLFTAPSLTRVGLVRVVATSNAACVNSAPALVGFNNL
jgi:hypothetical protein